MEFCLQNNFGRLACLKSATLNLFHFELLCQKQSSSRCGVLSIKGKLKIGIVRTEILFQIVTDTNGVIRVEIRAGIGPDKFQLWFCGGDLFGVYDAIACAVAGIKGVFHIHQVKVSQVDDLDPKHLITWIPANFIGKDNPRLNPK